MSITVKCYRVYRQLHIHWSPSGHLRKSLKAKELLMSRLGNDDSKDNVPIHSEAELNSTTFTK